MTTNYARKIIFFLIAIVAIFGVLLYLNHKNHKIKTSLKDRFEEITLNEVDVLKFWSDDKNSTNLFKIRFKQKEGFDSFLTKIDEYPNNQDDLGIDIGGESGLPDWWSPIELKRFNGKKNVKGRLYNIMIYDKENLVLFLFSGV